MASCAHNSSTQMSGMKQAVSNASDENYVLFLNYCAKVFNFVHNPSSHRSNLHNPLNSRT